MSALFRIDRFDVPAHALPTFMQRIEHTRQRLGNCSGCRQNLVLTQSNPAGETKVITVVEWSDEESLASAKASMERHYAQVGFDPAAFMLSLDVRADLGLYRSV